jgi:hypothetical protein
VVIIVGDRYRDQLLDGLGSEITVCEAATTEESKEIYGRLLKAGDVLLIMADYPM